MSTHRAIKDLQEGLTPINYTPLYGGPHPLSLERVLFVSGLDYPVSSKLVGTWNERRLTLEAFLIEIDYPQWVDKAISLTLSRQMPTALKVRELYCSNDVLYMRVLNSLDCYGLPWTVVKGSKGMSSFQVDKVSSLELEGGEVWRR